MRALAIAVCCVVLTGCTFGIAECDTNRPCKTAGALCVEGFCTLADASTGGGTGGGATGGGGGSTTGGGTATGGGTTTGGGDGTGGGGQPMCPDMGCAEGCIEGMGCVPWFESIRINSPDAGASFREGMVRLEAELIPTAGIVVDQTVYPGILAYSIDDGGTLALTQIPASARYTAQYTASSCGALKQISWTVSLEDGGLSKTSNFECDGQNPTLRLPTFSSGYYQRDDVIVFDLGADEPLNKDSVSVQFGGAPVSESTTGADGGVCDALGKCWSLDFSKPELRGMDGGFSLTANATDVAGNSATAATASLSVTRLRWRVDLSAPVIAAPAVSSQGRVVIGTAATSRTGSLHVLDALTGLGDAGISLGAVQGVAVSPAATQAGMPPDSEYAFVTFNTTVSNNPNGRLHAFDIAALTPSPASVCQAYGSNRTLVAPALVRTDGDQVAAVASSNNGGGDDGRFLRWDSRLGCNKSVDLTGLNAADLNHDAIEPPMNAVVVNAASGGAFAHFVRYVPLSYNQLRRVTGLRSTVSVDTTAEGLDGGGAISQVVVGTESLISNLKPTIGNSRLTRTSYGGTAKEWDLGNNTKKGAVAVQTSTEAYVGNGEQIVRFDPSNTAIGPVPLFTAIGQSISLSPVLLGARSGSTNDWGYAVSDQGALVAFDRHGTATGWSAPMRTSDTVGAHPGFGCNTKPNHAPGTGVLYVAWRDGVVQAIIVDGSELDGLWPKYQRSMGNAGNDDTAFFPTNWTCP